ncbi:MAG: ABC transporter ATP-binding protein [Alphaproteobacteria bacterium]|jgi:oligopeptide/dipeptide ABC transporter ATP-binding protein|nr:peptide ABC transporter ATP-binding protein [Rhodospirillaceae bacterium]MDP6023098.1 ABC transporter ATP-binding protein [Alphaproteobacteria bacterium]MDP6256097.1 ABC transporter ATP-binding protein [Alphaproteobacteria bacterium]MDP7054649.1 ABC transporter ATP-binding protein [Alphaproteobacteria bacterium]MDP7228609.1 ABC transporter ATP-binding protein [Alphaproteobacteria bacterium]|tara:strand:+ start:5352 stop:6344 length:993 start_codon:yes stop_codon:yes gene_type:complete
MTEPLLRIEDLRVEFDTRDGVATVIDGLDISLYPGEILGIVGESGCGKSMTALSIMRLVPMPPGRIAKGTILLDGEDLLQVSEKRMRNVRGNAISMIFQEPMTSLNPVFSVGDQIAETILLHEGGSKRAAWQRAVEMLDAVGIPAPKVRAREYPHQMSGGMRQRVMIAMALACQPRVLIADEPTTALDVTVQAQIFDLLKDLQKKTGAVVVLITHDMGAIAEMAHRVVVMYAGRKVEDGPVDEILTNPKHPYTSGLIGCVPHLSPDPSEERLPLMDIPGVVPPMTRLGQGCPFAPRCSEALDKCRSEIPAQSVVGENHRVSCWLIENGGP